MLAGVKLVGSNSGLTRGRRVATKQLFHPPPPVSARNNALLTQPFPLRASLPRISGRQFILCCPATALFEYVVQELNCLQLYERIITYDALLFPGGTASGTHKSKDLLQLANGDLRQSLLAAMAQVVREKPDDPLALMAHLLRMQSADKLSKAKPDSIRGVPKS